MVIPVHDANPTRRTPWVTYALIIVNFVVFFALEPINHFPTVSSTQTVGQFCEQQRFFDDYAAVPKELIDNQNLPPHRVVVSTNQGPVACPVVKESVPPVLTVLTAMFLHGGLLHILGNMLFLWVFGNNIEDRLGPLRYLVFYLVAGYVATYAFAFANAGSTESLIGASGAIAGVLGSYLVLYPRARVTTLVPFLFFIPFRLPAWVVLGFWFVLQYAYASGSAVASGAGVAYLAHVAGFVFGVLVTLLLLDRHRPAPLRQV